MLYIIDTYAWMEYFIGSKKGEVLIKLLSDETNELITVDCCLAEIKGWSLRNSLNFEQLFNIIRANSKIILMSENNWIQAGKERFEQRKTQKDFGLIDSAILVKQKELRTQVVSGDKHFKNLKNIVFLD